WTISSDDLVAPGLPPARPLADLVASLQRHEVRGDRSVDVVDVGYRSQDAVPGSLFFCVPGSGPAGHDFAGGGGGAGRSPWWSTGGCLSTWSRSAFPPSERPWVHFRRRSSAGLATGWPSPAAPGTTV